MTLKRLFSTGPEAFQDIRERLEQLAQSLASDSAPSDSGKRNAGAPEKPHAPSTAVIETMTSLALAVDAKDPYTQGHSQKVSDYAVLLAEELGLGEEEIEAVRLGALLHDVGKVGIPAALLAKNGPLDPDEWETMKEHFRLGDRLLEPLPASHISGAWFAITTRCSTGQAIRIAWRGEDIPLGARIIAIADAYDTITSDRSYHKGRTSGEALTELARCAGAQYDPELVPFFVRASERQLHGGPVLAQQTGK